MFRNTRTIKFNTVLASAAVMAAVAAPTASAYQDLRSPDTRDAALQSQSVQVGQDLRSPDTRDAAAGRPVGIGTRQDLRSPDTRDVALRYEPQPVSFSVVDDGTDWVPIVLGLVGIAGLILLLTGFMINRRPTFRGGTAGA